MQQLPKEDVWRWVKTTAVLLAMTNAGMNLGIFSPTFPDMAAYTSTTMGQMATTMTWVGVASIIGALCMGPLFDRFDGLLVLSVSLALQGLAIGVAPWSRLFFVFQIMAGIASIFGTGIMTGSLSANCIIWKKKPEMISPIIQVTDLFHAFGTAITPQIIEPFLVGTHLPPPVPNPTTVTPPHPTNVTSAYDEATTAVTNATSPTRHGGPEPVQIAYVIIAVLDVIIAIVCFVVFLLDRGQTKAKSHDYGKSRMVRSRSYSLNEDGVTIVAEEFQDPPRERSGSLVRDVLRKNFGKSSQPHSANDIQKMVLKRQELQRRKELRLRSEEEARQETGQSVDAHGLPISSAVPAVSCNTKILPFFLIAISFFTVNGGRDAMFTGLLFTYLNGYLHWTTSSGTLLVTFYHVTRVVIHVVFVFLAKCVSPVFLTVANIIFLVVSSVLMLLTVYANPVFTVLAVILTGFATSNLHASAITLAQRSFQVDGKVMGMLIGAVFFGTSINSPIVGLLLDSYGAISFPAILVTITVLTIIFFVIWLIGARSLRRRMSQPSVVGEVLVDETTPLMANQSPTAQP